MHIHFVCTGNTYRSRLAEAYLKSKEVDGLRVSSSGVMAETNMNGPVSWYTVRLLKHAGILQYMSMCWTQATNEILVEPDLVIFMEPFHYNYAKDHFNFSGQNFEIWDVPDVDNQMAGDRDAERQCILLTEGTFQKIREKVDNLMENLKNNY